MASILTENSIRGDRLIFDNIMDYAYKNWRDKNPLELLEQMVSHGVLQIDALVEQAISRKGGLKRESVEGRDFEDGSDAKKANTQWLIEDTQTRRVATIKNIQGKQGVLRIIVAETLTDHVYYFKVPRRAYRGLKQISIYFNGDGSPKAGKWFEYEVSTFEELSS